MGSAGEEAPFARPGNTNTHFAGAFDIEVEPFYKAVDRTAR